MAVNALNSRADVLKKTAALAVNCNAAKGLEEVLKSNLGPRGTLKMLVGGAGQIKITKDGNVLLHEMQIQHPTAAMIGRASTAQDDITGDGTTSNVILIGELMKQAERHIAEGVHPRLLCEGFDLARTKTLEILDKFKTPIDVEDRELLTCVARTSLFTKLQKELADRVTDMVVDAVRCVRQEGEPIDLFMVEMIHMRHKLTSETRLVKGLVLDHGCRHPDMPRGLKKVLILTCNVSLEYEKAEVNSGFFYSSAEQRDKLVIAERKFTDEKVKKIIDLKRKVCTEENGYSFIVLNQKGIDPPSLDMLAKEGCMALRRVKRRNMERLVKACGGRAVNSVEDLDESDLGYAETVSEETLGDDKYTFVEGVRHPQSCTILVKGPTDHAIVQIKDAVRDGLRAVKNAIEDGALVAGAGAFELAAAHELQNYKKEVSGKARLGVASFAEALLAIPKILAENSGLDPQDTLLALQERHEKNPSEKIGLDIMTGDACLPADEGIWDCYRVKRQMIALAPSLAQQLLLVDEVIKAGKQMGKG
uniref:T-complex protein 1 subunit zeta n=1 Tax=Chromera velia CCMP2878 TaxID=1169474 RepID=A0A0G4HS46_9ALVE|mmetsp:Transcript_15445/g.31354  ORF Transcript_15445/g.31354 Transcript_15445/m.31354 type:complete len:534 (+) Transcript_15445:317-1918(+)|eukprot:Cvel_8205.t1-p1 / transcript=Cvel_8205.t1 / gene=Cvel_8205 / organism=Chromera_velia_CCMP2878 / gene_product=T-complex protein 1 subunit zeta, putative / transcript_product=T-complex protein 1 subunit zeta, putative / location=Cvel_scaffold447:48912-53573(+) / protein_length=533 / sequence_SO=supercontig / SO=protein_coding / is_pseudo=false